MKKAKPKPRRSMVRPRRQHILPPDDTMSPEDESAFGGVTGLKNVTFGQAAFWLDLDPRDREWVEALEAFDKRRDLEPLRRLVRVGGSFSTGVGRHFNDFLDRHFNKRKRRTPTYDLTVSEKIWFLAVDAVRNDIAGGMPKADAMIKNADRFGVEVENLDDAFNGKLGSFEDAKRRIAGVTTNMPPRRSTKKPSKRRATGKP